MKIYQSNVTLHRETLLITLEHAIRNMERNYEDINLLNVFPVPDGDTGINMLLTLKSIEQEVDSSPIDDAKSLLEIVNRGALLGARGNSGVILSQFIRGFCSSLSKNLEINASSLNEAFKQATISSYQAVSNPVEGTMLTVMKGVSDSINKSFDSGEINLFTLFQNSILDGVKTLESTPDLLPILKKAGVVDAGGQGFLVILDGIWRLISKIDPNEQTIPIYRVAGKIDNSFFDQSKLLEFGFCTQFLISGENLNDNEIKIALDEISNSIVVIGDHTLQRVHAHSEKPDTLVKIAKLFGIVSEINIQNMDDQHEEFLDSHEVQIIEKDIRVISVVNGQGLEKIFKELGSDYIINGGQTHNPSVQEFLDVINSMHSNSGIILTNNSNVIPAAMQAKTLSEKDIQVVPTKNIPEGIAAIIGYSTENELIDNCFNMSKSIEQVTSGEIVTAIRDAEIDNFQVNAGEYMGFINGKLQTTNTTLNETVIKLLEQAITTNPELITLYWGGELSEKISNKIFNSISSAYPNIEIELVYGGQDYYHFLISVE